MKALLLATITGAALLLTVGWSTAKTNLFFSSAGHSKGAQRLIEMGRANPLKNTSGKSELASKSPPRISDSLTMSTNSGWAIHLINAEPDTVSLFDAFLREMPGVIGVERLQAPSGRASFLIRCVFRDFKTFRSEVESAIKLVSENGLLTSTEVILPAKLGFTNCTVMNVTAPNAGLAICLATNEPPRVSQPSIPTGLVSPPAESTGVQTSIVQSVTAPLISESDHPKATNVGDEGVMIAFAILAALFALFVFAFWGLIQLSKVGLRHLRKRAFPGS